MTKPTAWFYIANPGDLGGRWPAIHLYEVTQSGVETPLDDAERDVLVKDMATYLSGQSASMLNATFLGNGGFLSYTVKDAVPEKTLHLCLVEIIHTEAMMADAARVRHPL